MFIILVLAYLFFVMTKRVQFADRNASDGLESNHVDNDITEPAPPVVTNHIIGLPQRTQRNAETAEAARANSPPLYLNEAVVTFAPNDSPPQQEDAAANSEQPSALLGTSTLQRLANELTAASGPPLTTAESVVSTTFASDITQTNTQVPATAQSTISEAAGETVLTFPDGATSDSSVM